MKEAVLNLLFSPHIKGKISLEPDEVDIFEKKFTGIKLESRKFIDDKVVIFFSAPENMTDKLMNFSTTDAVSFQ